ncbi:MAG: DUF222 domain-containing protein [Actinomycetota bacterium]
MFDIVRVAEADLVDVVTSSAAAAARAEAIKLAAIAELWRRRRRPERERWVCADWDATAAEIGCALNMSPGRASVQMDLALALRDRFPRLGAMLADGRVSLGVVTTIVFRTALVLDPATLATLDGHFADAVAGWGVLSQTKLDAAVDVWIETYDPDAVRRVRDRVRGRSFTIGHRDDAAGTTSVYGTLATPDAALLGARLAMMIASVCEFDPRTLDQKRADSVGAMAAGSFVLACRCGRSECAAAQVDDRRASSITVTVIADHAALDAEPDPQLHGEEPQPAYTPRNATALPPGVEAEQDAEAIEPAESDEAEQDAAEQGESPESEDPDAVVEPSIAQQGAEPVEPNEPAAPVNADQSENGTAAESSAPSQLADSGKPPPAAEPSAPVARRRAALILGPGGGIVPAPLLAELIAHGATVRFVGAINQATEGYRPSAALDRFVRSRDLTCRFPGCDRPATHADIDHTVPYPHGATHPANTKCYCRLHHLLKTFWEGWTERQTPDGRLHLISPTGHPYTTAPLSALLFPSWNTRTGPPPTTDTTPPRTPGRTLMMPTRRRSRAENRAAYITRERTLNARERAHEQTTPSKTPAAQHNWDTYFTPPADATDDDPPPF